MSEQAAPDGTWPRAEPARGAAGRPDMISGTLIFVVALAVGVAVAVRPEAPHGPVVGVAVGGGLFLGLMAAPLGVAAVWQRLDGWARRFRAR